MDVTVVTSGHDVADARLHREVAALLRAGLVVEVLGLGDPRSGPPGAAVTTRPRAGLPGRACAAALLPWQAHGRVLLCLDPDTVPSASLRRWTGRRLVVDVHEDYAALLRDRSWAVGVVGWAGALLVRLSTWLAARADLTVVADDHVPPAAARRRLVIRNLPDLAMLPGPGPRDVAPRALYVGDLRASRGLFAMLRALETAPAWTLDLVGPVAERDQEALRAWRDSSPAADRVRLHGRLPPQKAWELARGAWAGLALLDRTPAFEAAVPSKLYEYLACGLPVVVTPLPRMQALVEDSGSGAVAATGEEAGRALCGWSDDPDAHGRAAAEGLTWSVRTRARSPYDVLAEHVTGLLSPSGHAPSRWRRAGG